MKLKDLGDSLIFDDLPLAYNPKHKIILTHLLHIHELILPNHLPMIYTTKILADQLLTYCETKNYQGINKNNLFIITPYDIVNIVLEKRRTLQILFCSSEDTRNLMVLIKESGKLNYLYAGNFVDIRFALLNDTFASWITDGVEKIYVNTKRMDENHIFNDIDQMQKVFNIIEEIIDNNLESKINIHLPLFGYESFILKLTDKIRNRIALDHSYKQFYIVQNDDPDLELTTHLCDSDNAKILLLSDRVRINFNDSNLITITIKSERSKCIDTVLNLKSSHHKLFYSPEPSPFQLKLLCMLVKPKRIFSILDTFNNKSKIPQYLSELCVEAKDKIQKKQQRKLNRNAQIHELPKSIVVGRTLKKNIHTDGLFLNDTDSDE